MKMKRFVFMPLIGITAIAGFSAGTMLLWNCLIPGIFGLTAISFWQALGLLALARLLFGGFGHHHMMRGRMHRGMHHHHGMHGCRHGHNPIREKWSTMSPEERKEFMEKIYKERMEGGHHCGHHHE